MAHVKSFTEERPKEVWKRVKEQFANARNGHLELLAVAEHALEGHEIKWKPNIVEVAGKTRV